jgi:hypothetical protein
MKRFRKPLIVFLVSIVIIITGAFLHFTHYAGADILMIAGLILQAFAVAMAAFAFMSKTKSVDY